ncbi:MAG: UPF0280 family protein [Desulfamplus sp.]|nr:UPF0280 family protein [Desulfamplus sp.]MBF0242496.1 UPF0280 family protein [Desulfamplus sp.]
MFENRKYRLKSNRQGLNQFSVTVKESDLHIQAESDLSKIATKKILELRGFIEEYAKMDPQFITSLVPIEPLIAVVPEIVADMVDAAKKAGVGPMAAVAGAIAQHTGVELLKYSSEVIVENGGDIFFKINSPMVFSIFAGKSPLSMKVGARIEPNKMDFIKNGKNIGMALCTSSGTVGHSISFGKADAATVISPSCSIADAAATALGNIVKKESDIEKAIEAGQKIKGVEGIIIIKGRRLGAWGNVELVKIA